MTTESEHPPAFISEAQLGSETYLPVLRENSQSLAEDISLSCISVSTRCTLKGSEAAKSGEFYPGRPLVRKRVVFKSKAGEGWREECAKHHRYSHTHSPGLFTVQCACPHPKLLGVVVMDESESIYMAVKELFTRFDPPPRIVFYDNACNLALSVALRLSRIFEYCTFLCDRFHYTGYRCSGVFDPETQKISY